MAGRIRTFLSDNIVLVVGIPCIGVVHWCWLQLQKIDTLVPPEQRKLEQPIVRGFRVLKNETISKFFGEDPPAPPPPSSEKRNH